MINRCTLETEGYQVTFNLESNSYSPEDIALEVEFRLNTQIKELSIKSIPSFIAINDLQRLGAYLEKHIAVLIQNPESESEVFLDYGLSFQLQAFSGDVESENEGSFSIQVMVNLGQYNELSSRTYVGGLSVATVESIQNFISSIHTVVAKLSRENTL